MVAFYHSVSPNTPAMGASPERIMSWVLTSVVAVTAIDLFKASGMKIGKGLAEINANTWKQILFVGFISSVLNSVGQSLNFSGQIMPDEGRNVMIGFLVGDTSGTLLCFLSLLFLFRGYRWLTLKV